MMRASRSILVAGGILAVTFLGLGVARADPTAGSLLVPPESIGPQTYVYTDDAHRYTTYFDWPNYLTGVGAGTTWHFDVLGIDVSGLTGSDGRAARFQFQNVIPIGGTIYDYSPQQWTSLMFNVKLYNAGTALIQLQESYYLSSPYAQNWYGLRSVGFNAGVLTRDHFDLRMEIFKAAEGDAWTVTPYYRLDGGVWTLFDGGAATTHNSWDFGSREDGFLYPDYGGAMFNFGFTSGGTGTFSIDDARIVPLPPAMVLGLLGLGAAYRRCRKG